MVGATIQLAIHVHIRIPLPSSIAVMIRFSRASYTVNEVAGTVEVGVQISSASEIVTVTVRTVDGTALGEDKRECA